MSRQIALPEDLSKYDIDNDQLNFNAAFDNGMTRREFIKLAALTGAGMAMMLRSSRANAIFDLSIISNIAAMTNPQALKWVTGGCCDFLCATTNVTHYLPVALVEVLKMQGSSIFDPTGLVGAYATSTTDTDGKRMHSYEARIWDIPAWITALAFPLQDCKLAPKATAQVGLNAATTAISRLQAFLCSAATDVIVDQLQAEALKWLGNTVGDCFPRLLYDSAVDAFNWRSGCRDMSMASLVGPAVCSNALQSVAASTTDVFLGGLQPCMGAWGSILPRQMKVDYQNHHIGAAMTAYRAIHIARYTLGTFPYKGQLIGTLQPSYPYPLFAYFPGDPMTAIPGYPTPVSYNGNYGFIWWEPVTMCLDTPSVLTPACPVPPIPCMAS